MVTKIIIATHKKYKMPNDKSYLPLQVGAILNDDLGYEKDSIGDNISNKNPSFCELTGLYWAWKNLDADYIGLVHYRRYFSYKKVSKDPFKNILTDKQINELTQKFDLIIPKKRHYYIESLYTHYKHTHYETQLNETREILSQQYPEYLRAYDQMVKKSWGYMFNMMILRKNLLDNYCTWLFNILFELEKRVDNGEVKNSQNLSSFQARFYGRISEILFNVWLKYQLDNGIIENSKVKNLKVINIGKIDWGRKLQSFILAKFFNKKYDRSF